MKDPKFTIETSFTKDTYKSFLYVSAFKKNRLIWLYLIVVALLTGLIIGLSSTGIDITRFIISASIFFVLAIITLVVKVEVRLSRRLKTDNTGSFDSVTRLEFYDKYIFEENRKVNSSGEIKYEQFFSLAESKDLFIFYLNANQASLINKADITSDYDAFREFIIEKFKGRYKKI